MELAKGTLNEMLMDGLQARRVRESATERCEGLERMVHTRLVLEGPGASQTALSHDGDREPASKCSKRIEVSRPVAFDVATSAVISGLLEGDYLCRCGLVIGCGLVGWLWAAVVGW